MKFFKFILISTIMLVGLAFLFNCYAYDNIGAVVYSPDNQRKAYAAQIANRWVVVIDNKEGHFYDTVDSITFSQNSKHVMYKAKLGEKWMVVLDGQEDTQQYDAIDSLAFTQDENKSIKVTYKAQNDDKWDIVEKMVEKVEPKVGYYQPGFGFELDSGSLGLSSGGNNLFSLNSLRLGATIAFSDEFAICIAQSYLDHSGLINMYGSSFLIEGELRAPINDISGIFLKLGTSTSHFDTWIYYSNGTSSHGVLDDNGMSYAVGFSIYHLSISYRSILLPNNNMTLSGIVFSLDAN